MGFKRLQELLELKDYVHPSNKSAPKDQDSSIELQGACLAWETIIGKEGKKTEQNQEKQQSEPKKTIEYIPCLFDLNFNAKKGDLIGVAGGVGSGKTSLISALMGEVRLQL